MLLIIHILNVMINALTSIRHAAPDCNQCSEFNMKANADQQFWHVTILKCSTNKRDLVIPVPTYV
jgi:hypothetical protein